jgi:hypothetical protein
VRQSYRRRPDAVEALREQLTVANQRAASAERQLEQAETERRRLTTLLTDRTNPPAAPKRSWWRWRR